MNDKIVLALSSNGANDAIRGLMAEYGNALQLAGISVVHVSFEPAEIEYAVTQISEGNVLFGITFLGIGQDLMVKDSGTGKTSNVWDTFDIPLLKLHGDLPAYFSDFHRDIPRTSVNMYHAKEFLEFRRGWLSQCATLAATVPPLPLSPISRDEVNIERRCNGKLVFLKNGNSPAELRLQWNEILPASVSRTICNMADELHGIGMQSGYLRLGDAVADHLLSQDIDPRSIDSLFFFFCAQMDDYLRRVKSQLIADTILDFPVLVQGSLWEHVDFGGRKARLVPGEDFSATQRVYNDQLGIIDMSANVDTWPHDRVQRAAGAFATVITNRQGWLTDGFPEFAKLTFDFSRESISERVEQVIVHPREYVELGVAFGEKFRTLYSGEAFANRVIDLAELAMLRNGEAKPSIQRFFVWPRP